MRLEEADRVRSEFWDQDVGSWQKYWVPIFKKFAHDLVKDAKLASGNLVLDIGTGTGIAAFEAAKGVKPDGFVFGIDRSEPMLTRARHSLNTRKLRNLRFVRMDAQDIIFPSSLFNAVVSNCGLPNLGFRQIVEGVFRVLAKNGVLVYNQWQLRDVPVHRTFGEALEKYRTKRPSGKLARERVAFALLERYSHRELGIDTQLRELKRAGFRNIGVKRRKYGIKLESIEDYLNMRMKRRVLIRELAEMPTTKLVEFRRAVREDLARFVQGGRFILDWNVDFVVSKKPSNSVVS